MRWDIGIDLGTETARVAEYRHGLILEAAAKVAFRDGRDIPICCGDVAGRIEGRTCQGVRVFAPIKDGVLSNNMYADRYLRWAYRQCPETTRGKRFTAMITCAPFCRPVQREALLSAATDAGAIEASLVRTDAAAAIGAGLSINEPEAKMIVDIGAGKITATVFSMGRVSAFGYLPYGMNRIDERIVGIIRTEKGFRIGMKSARDIKHALGTALPETSVEELVMHMTGIQMESGMPRAFDIDVKPVVTACEDVVREIIHLCNTVLSMCPHGAAADLFDSGVILTGSGALLQGLAKRIGDSLHVPCKIANGPSQCAGNGLLKIMEDPDAYASIVINSAYRGSTR